MVKGISYIILKNVAGLCAGLLQTIVLYPFVMQTWHNDWMMFLRIKRLQQLKY